MSKREVKPPLCAENMTPGTKHATDAGLSLGVPMFYYSYFSGQGRAAVSKDLNVANPFSLGTAEIVERVLRAGFTPAVEHPLTQPWRQMGTPTEVVWDGLVFIVSVSRDAEMIGVQEVRAERYDSE